MTPSVLILLDIVMTWGTYSNSFPVSTTLHDMVS
jgi:hypothetical protein